MHYFGVKTLSETLFSPPLMHPGDGARFLRAWVWRGGVFEDAAACELLGEAVVPLAAQSPRGRGEKLQLVAYGLSSGPWQERRTTLNNPAQT